MSGLFTTHKIMRERGLEPPRDYLPSGPQPDVSTNSTIPANIRIETVQAHSKEKSRANYGSSNKFPLFYPETRSRQGEEQNLQADWLKF